jgi:hypothetical protein
LRHHWAPERLLEKAGIYHLGEQGGVTADLDAPERGGGLQEVNGVAGNAAAAAC